MSGCHLILVICGGKGQGAFGGLVRRALVTELAEASLASR